MPVILRHILHMSNRRVHAVGECGKIVAPVPARVLDCALNPPEGIVALRRPMLSQPMRKGENFLTLLHPSPGTLATCVVTGRNKTTSRMQMITGIFASFSAMRA